MKMITKTNKTPMKKNIYIYLAIICISISNVNAQDYLSFYNLEDYVVQTQNISPVYIPKNSFTFAIPGANLGFNFNSGFKVNELLVQDETTNTLTYNLGNLYDNAEDVNDMNIDLTVNLFYMAFKRKRGSLTIFANTKVTNNWRYSKDFLKIAAQGITQNFTLNDQNEYTGYNEIGIGFTQTFLNDRLAIAVRAKYLNGMVHSSTADDGQVSLEIDETTGEYTIYAENATVNSAGSVFFENSDEEFKFFTGNTGFGFDFGATFKATKKLTIELAVNDIGSIDWTEDVKNFNIEDTGAAGVLYDGINLRPEDGGNIGTDALDKLEEITETNETFEGFETKLNMKSYASLRYALTEKNTFTLAAFNTHAFDEFEPSYSLGYNRTLKKTTYGVLASMGGVDNELLFGANFAVKLGPLQLYAATDSLKAIFEKPEEATGANVRVGLNFVFGYNKHIQKPIEE